MRAAELIKLLKKGIKEHGQDVEVYMDIFDTNTSKEWNYEDSNLIGIRDSLGFEKIRFCDIETYKFDRKITKCLKILPNYTN